MPEKPDLEMTAGMAYDPSGAAEAKADVADTAATAETAAASTEQAAQKSANAEAQSTAAATKATQAEKALAETMRLVAMGKRALVEEIKRLSAARKAAAASGDQKQYEKLSQSLNAAKQALEGVNTAQQMAQISSMQQAQTGMQMAQGFANLAEMSQNAGANIAGMANQVLALGMAFKSGLGPIGWVMMALEGLQMVIGSYVKSQSEASQAIKDFAKDVEEACAHMEESARKVAEMRLKDNERIQSQEEKNAKERLDTKLRTMDAEAKANQDNRERELKEKRAALDAEIALEKEKAEKPGGDKAAFEKWRQEKEAQFREEEKMAREKTQNEAKERAAAELAGAQEIAAIRREAYDKLTDKYVNIAGMGDEERGKLEQALSDIDKLREQKKAAMQRVEDLNKQMEDLKKAGGREDEVDKLRRLRTEAENEAKDVAEKISDRVFLLERDTKWMGDLLKQDQENLSLSGEALARRGLAIAQEGNARREAAEAAEREVQQQQQQADEIGRQTTTTKETTEAQERLQRTQDEIAFRRAHAEQQAADIAEKWDDVQKQAQPKRIAWLKETLAGLEEGTAVQRQYNKLLQQELTSQETAVRQEEWQRVQRECSLEEQAVWLRKTVGHLEAGSEEAKKWAEQLQGVETRKIQDALGKLEKEFKVTGSYVAEDKRTQRQILQDDKKALAGRAQRLQALIAETKDFSLRQQLQEKLDETVKQQKALEAATAANAKACRAMLKGYKAPEFHDKNKMVERNLKQLGHAYARNIKLAEKAAEKGDTKAQERYTRLAGKYADRIARKRKDFTKEHEKNLDAIQAAQKKQKNEEEESAKDSKKSRSRKNREDAKQKPKKDAPKQNAPKQNAAPAQHQKKEHELADTKAALADAQKALGDMSGKVAELAGVTAQIASAATEIAKTAGAKLKSLKKQLKTMQTDISNLWKEIDA